MSFRYNAEQSTRRRVRATEKSQSRVFVVKGTRYTHTEM